MTAMAASMPSGAPATNAPSSTVFVRNLPPGSVHSDLTNLFSSLGPVKKSSVIKPANAPDGSLNFGFVKFVTVRDAERAAKDMNGAVIEKQGRRYKIMVEIAVDKGQHKVRKSSANSRRDSDTTHTVHDD